MTQGKEHAKFFHMNYLTTSLLHFSELQSEYMPAVPHHLDYRYKKAAYVEYTDATFTRRKNSEQTLLGPLLKGKVNDQLHVSSQIWKRCVLLYEMMTVGKKIGMIVKDISVRG